MLSKIIELRKGLHQNPELSGVEFNTARRIRSFLGHYPPTKVIEQLGGSGLAAVYEFSTSGPVVAIRCELDALPIEEENDIDHRSTVKGVSHKCGHDGHMAIVAGLIFRIKAQHFTSGKIVLLFQPAEETGKGAQKVLEDRRFEALNIDYIFALHNIPGESFHSIITMGEGFSAEVQSVAIQVKGREAHASEPENGTNPAVGISALIMALDALNVNDPHDQSFAVLTPVYGNMGQKSYGISPANGELHYTVRTWSRQSMISLKSVMEDVFEKVCHEHELEFNASWFEYFPASQNDEDCNRIIAKAAKASALTINERPYPFRFGEDFGWFSRKYKTGMFGLGAGGGTPALHDARYDFPDELIDTGIKIFTAIISEVFQRE